MNIENLLEITTRAELRSWLENNNLTEKCCWVIISIKPKDDTLLYLDVVEESLCFGWIDGIKKKLPNMQLAQRFSPRTSKSTWTELNKERIRRLEKLNLMTPHGIKTLPNMNTESFIINPIIEEKLKEDSEVYTNFLGLPELYKRIRIDNIQRNLKDETLFTRQLAKFLKHTKENKIYGQWNDNGRLIDY